MDVREFRVVDGAAVRAFWEASGIRIRPGDDDRSLAAFVDRNPGLFLIAQDERGLGGRLVRIIEERLKGRECRGLLRVREAHTPSR